MDVDFAFVQALQAVKWPSDKLAIQGLWGAEYC